MLILQKDGSLTLKDSKTYEEYWTSHSGGMSRGPYRVEMPEVGFFKIVDQNGKAIWSAD